MGAFLDSIFNRTYYKEVLASYELVNNKFYDAYKIWLEHESNEDDCTYSFKVKVHNNLEIIKQIDRWIRNYKALLKNSPKAIQWFFYQKGYNQVNKMTYKEYKLVDDCNRQIIQIKNELLAYSDILANNKEAVNRFLGHANCSHTYDEIDKIVASKEKIEKYTEILNKAHNCEKFFPNAWKVFAENEEENGAISIEQLSKINEYVFESKEKFLQVFNRKKNLILLILGQTSHDYKSFDQDVIKSENDVLAYLEATYEHLMPKHFEVQIKGDCLKRAILDSLEYGGTVRFNENYTISQFYNLRKQFDCIDKTFDNAVTLLNYNQDGIKRYNYIHHGESCLYIEDYLRIVTEGSDLKRFVENYKEESNLRKDAKAIAQAYHDGYLYYFNVQHDFDNCDINFISRIIDARDKIKEKDSEIKRQRQIQEEKEQKQRELENIKQHISTWESIGNFINISYLFPYYPTTCDFEANDLEWANRWLVWKFKNTPGKTSSYEHNKALENLLPRISQLLSSTFGKDIYKLVLVCIPAANKANNDARYKEFSNKLTELTGMTNSFEHIQIVADATPKHLGGTGNPTLHFDEDFFKDKYVILFDDVITSGRSMIAFKIRLERMGAKVIAGMSIGKTKHIRNC